jgi:hypothetical protein
LEHTHRHEIFRHAGRAASRQHGIARSLEAHKSPRETATGNTREAGQACTTEARNFRCHCRFFSSLPLPPFFAIQWQRVTIEKHADTKKRHALLACRVAGVHQPNGEKNCDDCVASFCE